MPEELTLILKPTMANAELDRKLRIAFKPRRGTTPERYTISLKRDRMCPDNQCIAGVLSRADIKQMGEFFLKAAQWD